MHWLSVVVIVKIYTDIVKFPLSTVNSFISDYRTGPSALSLVWQLQNQYYRLALLLKEDTAAPLMWWKYTRVKLFQFAIWTLQLTWGDQWCQLAWGIDNIMSIACTGWVEASVEMHMLMHTVACGNVVDTALMLGDLRITEVWPLHLPDMAVPFSWAMAFSHDCLVSNLQHTQTDTYHTNEHTCTT